MRLLSNTIIPSVAALALSLTAVACGGDDDEVLDPEIVSVTADVTTIEAGGTIQLTVETMHFELVGHDHDH
ncbi:MAG: hypothetical protein AAGC55_17525, partial [Myxococcota bacterium]